MYGLFVIHTVSVDAVTMISYQAACFFSRHVQSKWDALLSG